jgi:hypothetical protein
VHLFGGAHRLFNVGGAVGIAGMALMLLTAVAHHTAALYRSEPISRETR